MSPTASPVGVLLVNLGTPDAPETAAVRRYLREFLGDPRVLTMPAPIRWLLLHGFILRTRPQRSAQAYQKVWTPEGSPLLVESRKLADAVAEELGGDFYVQLGMRYGEPSMAGAVDRLIASGIRGLIVVPLFPQFSEAATGSVTARVQEVLRKRAFAAPVSILGAFYDDPGWVKAVARAAKPTLATSQAEHVLMSFHGLPRSQIRASDPSKGFCLASPDCCDGILDGNRNCYRAQCFANAQAIARELDLPAGRWSVCFQSRLGPSRWIQPFTDQVLPELAERGVKRLAVLCPTFVADCLETLEEIGLRATDQWRELGGSHLGLAPCPNAQPEWAASLCDRIRAAWTPESSASATETPSR